MADNDNLFEGLRIGVVDFRKALQGESGNKLRQLEGIDGPVKDFIGKLLGYFYDALNGFYRLIILVENQLVQADGAIASLEIFSASMEPLSDPQILAETPKALGLPQGPFTALASAIDTLNEFIKAGLDIADILPAPEDVKEIRMELEHLLGVPERNIDGIYAELLETLSVPQLPES